MRQFWAALIFLAVAFNVKGEWEHLEGCELLDSPLNDGDSFMVMHELKVYLFRLYYVDCPEVSGLNSPRVTEQGEYFGISKNSAIKVGLKASKFTKDFLGDSFSIYTRWKKAWGQHERYAAIIVKDKKNLADVLVEKGMARIHGFKPAKDDLWRGMTPDDQDAAFKRLEVRAQTERIGAWRGNQTLSRLPIRAPVQAPIIPTRNQINLNLATKEELTDLPGIGPTLADRIIAGRPWRNLNDIKSVSGIGNKTFQTLQPKITVVHPDPPTRTADFFRRNPESHRNKDVSVAIQAVDKIPIAAPDGFVVLLAHTGIRDTFAGSIPIFFPEDRLQRVLQFYKTNSRSQTTAKFYNYQGTDVLVIEKK